MLSDLLQQFRYANQKRVLLESCLIKLAYPETEGTADALQQRIGELERQIAKGVKIVGEIEGKETDQGPLEELRPTIEKLPKAQFEDYQELRKNWGMVLSYFDQPLKGALTKSRIYPGKDRNSMLIIPVDDTVRNLLLDKKEIEEILQERLHKKYHFHIGHAEERERRTQYVSDEELAKVDMPIEITDN